MEEKILVSPGEGQTLEDLAKGLLALADDPHDVDYSPRTGGFHVPESVAARYAAAADTSDGKAQAKAAPRARAPRARSTAGAKGDTKTGRAGRSRKTPAKASPAPAKEQAKKGDKDAAEQVNDA